MSALPPISPSRLAAAAPVAYGVYPPALPSTDLPRRINPLRPEPPWRRTVSWETRDPHEANANRALYMKQREHYRYHNSWSKYYYGSPVEKEHHRTHLRTVLKQQMADTLMTTRLHRQYTNLESTHALQYDRVCLEDDARDCLNKHSYLATFRDENKKLMEVNWRGAKQRKQQNILLEREQLRFNPINWSSSLK